MSSDRSDPCVQEVGQQAEIANDPQIGTAFMMLLSILVVGGWITV